MKCMVLAFFISLPLFAIQWEVIGQKSNQPVYHGKYEANLSQSLGQITVAILEKNKIEYIGNENGINSMLGSPTGDALLVIESKTRMRAYGWCVKVDGKLLSVMPDKYQFTNQDALMTWYFGYMLYDNWKWFEECFPAYDKPLVK